MVTRDELRAALDAHLAIDPVKDTCPNGLQVEGRSEIRKIAFGVTASLALLERAAAWGADAVIVHHGLFWVSAAELRIERSMRRRLATLINHEMSLFAYHLPLDRHPDLGNNAVFARRLGATALEPAFAYQGTTIGVIATLPAPVDVGVLVAAIARETQRDPLVVAAGPPQVQRFGVVTGAAPKGLEEAVRLGLGLYLTGEPNEAVVHLAREERVHFVAAGHHATERFGVQALAAYVAERFGVETEYIEIANPV